MSQHLTNTEQQNSSYLIIIPSSEKDWDECKPNDACAVHGEADVLGLVEVLRDLSGLEGVPGAEEDEDHVVDEGEDQRDGGDAAGLHGNHHAGEDYLGKEHLSLYIFVLRFLYSRF